MLRWGANERIRVFHPIEVQLRPFLPFRADSLLPSIPLLFPISYFGLFQSRPYTYPCHSVSLEVNSFAACELPFSFGLQSEIIPASLIVFSSVVSDLSFHFLADCRLSRRFFIRDFSCVTPCLPPRHFPGILLMKF